MGLSSNSQGVIFMIQAALSAYSAEKSGWDSSLNWSVWLRKGGAGMNVVNQSEREGVFGEKYYPMIHQLCQKTLQLVLIKGVMVVCFRYESCLCPWETLAP